MNIDKLKERIVDVVPSIIDKQSEGIYLRPIRLADVLLAIEKKHGSPAFPWYKDNQVISWNLAKDNLDDQSDECKAFLISLLVR